ncbi:phosphoglycerate mutase [Ramlibacter terrae]|uniref:Phosphoglycerate mutase n=1 Tax=Ramlibacter terrae TaxID=2732511 RepID=A0ABX6P0U7_9BURK|nr:phosphoglycerate mutase [Ramlibacter terrae]
MRRLLARLGPPETDAGTADSLSPPHERALARAIGLPIADGLLPFAALQGGAAGEGCAWITPSHWRVGRDDIAMAHAQELQLDESTSRALLAAMQRYFAEDGITLEYRQPLQWLARGDLFRALPTASLDRVTGRQIERWMPSGDAGRPVRRLQQEMQMLLYTLPLNEERQARGLLPVNSFWVSGTGSLPAAFRPAGAPQVTQALREPALVDDGAARAAAWQRLDANEIAGLLTDVDAGRAVRLTLCGEANSRTGSSGNASFWRRVVARPDIGGMLGAL